MRSVGTYRPSPARRTAADVRQRIEETLAGGALDLHLGPGLASFVGTPALVAWAKLRGARRVTLEIPDSAVGSEFAIGSESARRLARAGLDLAKVPVAAGAGLETIQPVIRGLRGAGIEVELTVRDVTAWGKRLVELPERMAAARLGLDRLSVGVGRQRLAAGAAAVQGACRAIEDLAAAAVRHGVWLRLDPEAWIPPCLFERPSQVASLYSLARDPAAKEVKEGFHRVPACRECLLADRCPGFPQAVGALPEPRPIAERLWLRRMGQGRAVTEQIERELVTDDFIRGSDAGGRWVRTVRVNFRCNQSCHFCFVSTHLPSAAEARIRASIVEAGRRGMDIALSGGEPTLNPRLADYVELARRSGVGSIELQTNGTLLGETQSVEVLQQAGLDTAFVSLHGARAETGDAVTAAPGTWVKTVRGLDQLHRRGVATRISFVLCTRNAADFPDVVRLVATRWPGFGLTLSLVAPSTDLVPRTPDLIPRYSDVAPWIAEGLAAAAQVGLVVGGFESMCGMPLCLWPGDPGDLAGLAELAEGSDRGEMTKPPPCRRCRLESRCFGVRRGYVELYGYDELRPVSADPSLPERVHFEMTKGVGA